MTEIKVVKNKEVMKRKCEESTYDGKNCETSTKKLKETQESAEFWAVQYNYVSYWIKRQNSLFDM